jgi:hypothetical protein
MRNEGFVPGYLIADSGILFLFSANLSSSVRDKSFFLSPASLEHAEFSEKEDSGSRNQDSGNKKQGIPGTSYLFGNSGVKSLFLNLPKAGWSAEEAVRYRTPSEA